jgi:hypothetical protein
MNSRLFALSLFAFLGSYLILSLTFVSAYSIGESMNPGHGADISLGEFDARLNIVGEFPPLECGAAGRTHFEIYPENIPQNSRVAGIESFVSNALTGERYDVSLAVSCAAPDTLISNQLVQCSLNTGTLLSLLPQCPISKPENVLEIALVLDTDSGQKRVSASKSLLVLQQDIEPSLKIYWDILPLERQDREINCLAGDILSIPVMISHSEVLYGSMEWSFILNGTREYSGESISCSLSYPGTFTQDGRTDMYDCTLTIPNTMFPECVPNDFVSVAVRLQNGRYDIKDETDMSLFSEPLTLGMHIERYPSVIVCQAVSQQGACVPKSAQQTASVMITGNIPEKLRAFDFSYSVGDEQPSGAICERTTPDAHFYKCDIFIPMANLQGTPADNPTDFSGSYILNMSLTTQFLNNYTRLSDSKTIAYTGKLDSGVVDRMKQLEHMKNLIERHRNNYENAMKGLEWLKKVICCCALSFFVGAAAKVVTESLVKEGLGAGLIVLSEVIWIFIKNQITAKVAMQLLIEFGVGVVECALKAQEKAVQDTMKTLEDFQNKEDFSAADVTKKLGTCQEGDRTQKTTCWIKYWMKNAACSAQSTAQRFLSSISCGMTDCLGKGCFLSFFGPIGFAVCVALRSCGLSKCKDCAILFVACAFIIAVLWGTGLAPGASKVCNIIGMGLEAVAIGFGFIYLAVSMGDTKRYTDTAMAQVENQMKMAEDFRMSMTEYQKSQMDFLADLTNDTVIFSSLSKGMNLPAASMFFRSVSGGNLLEYNETICKGQEITIDYDVRSINASYIEIARLSIIGPEGTSITLALPVASQGLNGTIGPDDPDNLFRLSPDYTPSGEYDFIMDYSYGLASYKLYYVNETC